MKLFKTKEDKLAYNFEEYLKSMNLDSPNAECEIIDNKLEIIFTSLPYEEYLSFIKNNKYLKLYDDILGKYANYIPLSKELVNSITNDMYIEINNLLDSKIQSIKKEG